jgi:hypothetical protein
MKNNTSIPEIRVIFENYIKNSKRFKDNTPLETMEINGVFHHYMNPDTDTMWIGFALGYTHAEFKNEK